MTACRQELIARAKSESIPLIKDLLEEIMASSGFTRREILEAQLAVEEACTNIVMYAYPLKGASGEGSGEGMIHFSAGVDGDLLKMDIEDWGPPFDPSNYGAVLPTGGVEDRPAGGMGIYLIRKLTDEVAYQRLDGKNILHLAKIMRH